MSSIERVGVVGAGFMGTGIAESAVRCGLTVTVFEPQAGPLEASRARLEKAVAKSVAGGKLSEEDGAATVARASFTSQLADLAESQLVIEAIVEDLAIKQTVFGQLDTVLGAEAIVASNTSSIPITRLAAATDRADRVVGLHFFSPVPQMKLVEVVVGTASSDASVASAEAFVRQIDKTPIRTKDRAGFVVNILLVPYLMSAIRLFEAGHASKEDIDEGMRLGCGHPMGPLALCDLVGLDTLALVADSLHDEFKHPDYAAPPVLKRLVDAGFFGRKSGRGFYDYT